MGRKISEAMLKRFRDYAVEEPSYTISFAVWDLKQRGTPMSDLSIKSANDELLRLGVVKLIEDHGRAGKVYAYEPPKPARHISAVPASPALFPELDESRRVGELAPARGVVVPHTRVRGRSGKPGKDADRQARGVRVKKRTA